jgi:hypothetical protein
LAGLTSAEGFTFGQEQLVHCDDLLLAAAVGHRDFSGGTIG